MNEDKIENEPLEAFTVPEAAKLLHTTERTVRDWMRAGKLVWVELGVRRRILQKDIEAFLEARRTGTFRRLRANGAAPAEACVTVAPGVAVAPAADSGGGEDIPFGDADEVRF